MFSKLGYYKQTIQFLAILAFLFFLGVLSMFFGAYKK